MAMSSQAGGHGHSAIQAWLQFLFELLNHGGAILATTDQFIQRKDSGLGGETKQVLARVAQWMPWP